MKQKRLRNTDLLYANNNRKLKLNILVLPMQEKKIKLRRLPTSDVIIWTQWHSKGRQVGAQAMGVHAYTFSAI